MMCSKQLCAFGMFLYTPFVAIGGGEKSVSPRIEIEDAIRIARVALARNGHKGKDSYIRSAEFQLEPTPRWIVVVEGIPPVAGNHRFIVIDMARRFRIVDGR